MTENVLVFTCPYAGSARIDKEVNNRIAVPFKRKEKKTNKYTKTPREKAQTHASHAKKRGLEVRLCKEFSLVISFFLRVQF